MFGRNTHAAILHLGILLKFSVVIFEVMLEVVIFVKQRGRWDHQACQNIFLARIFYMTEYWPIMGETTSTTSSKNLTKLYEAENMKMVTMSSQPLRVLIGWNINDNIQKQMIITYKYKTNIKTKTNTNANTCKIWETQNTLLRRPIMVEYLSTAIAMTE